jgi:hypothetical protein
VTRVSFAEFRGVVRSPGAAPPASGGFPTPHPVRQAAIRRYHDQGLAAARQVLDDGLSRYWSRPGGPATQARNTRSAFARYVELDVSDGRPAAYMGLEHNVVIGSHTVGVRLDVVLFDEPGVGYDGRLLLWETAPCTRDLAELYAAPCVEAIEQRLGLPANIIDIWQLRHRTEFRVTSADARARIADVGAVLVRSLGP